jgi:hypothetical protein
MTSRATLEAEAIARRHALQASVAELRARLRPSQLSSDVGDALTGRLASAGQTLSDKAATPGGVVALCAMAFSSAFALGGGLPKSADDLPTPSPAPALPPGPQAPRETLLMLAELAAAIGVGAVASRYVPVTNAERTVLSGVGPELKRALHTHIEDQARRLVLPQSSRFGLINLVALGGAMLLSRKRPGAMHRDVGI